MYTRRNVVSLFFRSRKHTKSLINKAFVDIRLYAGVATPVAPYRPLRLNVTSSIKQEVHNVSQRCRRSIEPRPQAICIQNFAKIGPARGQTDTHTQTDGLITIFRTPTGRSNETTDLNHWMTVTPWLQHFAKTAIDFQFNFVFLHILCFSTRYYAYYFNV